MKYLNNEFDLGAESEEDASTSVEALEAQLGAVRERLNEAQAQIDAPQWRQLALQEGRLLVMLEKGDEAWSSAKICFDQFCNA